jgi:DNA-binding transcriptional LysR family regulator
VLFERSSRDGTLTDAGEVLREYAAKLLNLRAEASGALTELPSCTGAAEPGGERVHVSVLAAAAGRVSAAEPEDQAGGAAGAGELDLG